MPAEQQPSTKQHAVPQNVLGVQFKLVGNFTLKQFGIAVLGITLVFVVTKLPIPAILRIPIAAFILLGATGTAFIPIQDRSMDVWIRNFLRAVYSPTQWVWRKENEMPEFLTTTYQPTKKTATAPIQVQQNKSRQRLQSYIKGIEPTKQKETALDTLRKSRLEALQKSIFPNINPPTNKTEPPLPTTKVGIPNPGAVPTAVTPTVALTPPQPTTKAVLKGHDPPKGNPITTQSAPQSTQLPTTLPKTPVRQTTDLSQKLERLQQARSTKPKRQNRQVKAGIDYYKKEVVTQKTELAELATRNAKLQREIQYHQEIGKRNEELITMQKQHQLKIDSLQKQLDQAQTNKLHQQNLKQHISRISQLENQLKKKQPPRIPVPAPALKVPPTSNTPNPPPKKTLPLIQPKRPNVISGIVLSKEGRLIADAVVIIKDQDGDPIRALKTNSLGQFIVTTPLPNNKYTLGIKVANHSFSPVEASLTGSIVQPLIFRAK